MTCDEKTLSKCLASGIILFIVLLYLQLTFLIYLPWVLIALSLSFPLGLNTIFETFIYLKGKTK